MDGLLYAKSKNDRKSGNKKLEPSKNRWGNQNFPPPFTPTSSRVHLCFRDTYYFSRANKCTIAYNGRPNQLQFDIKSSALDFIWWDFPFAQNSHTYVYMHEHI